jgi:hypothetical protein
LAFSRIIGGEQQVATEQQGRMWRGGAVEEDLAISHSVRFTVHVQYVEENITSINNKFEAAVGWKILAKYDQSVFVYAIILFSCVRTRLS